jgi:hypothetical protein
MFIALHQAFKNTRRGTFSRGTVKCPACAAAVHLYKVEAVGEEFSTRCPGCGRRAFYRYADMAIEQFLERRAKPRAA